MLEQYWLPLSQGKKHPYTIVRSSRAKYIRVKLSNTGLLSLVIPISANLKHGQEFIQRKTAWIEKQLKTIDIMSDDLPDLLDLKLLKERWNVIYFEKNTQHLYLSEKTSNTLAIKGNIKNKALVKKVINKWCQYKAKHIFREMLNDIAIEHGFDYRKLTVRSQKTRWGSCSQDKNINLNSKLLFFNEQIVRYVIIHELCHTIEMNHSKRFWALVKDCDPNYQKNRKLLKTLGVKIRL